MKHHSKADIVHIMIKMEFLIIQKYYHVAVKSLQQIQIQKRQLIFELLFGFCICLSIFNSNAFNISIM